MGGCSRWGRFGEARTFGIGLSGEANGWIGTFAEGRVVLKNGDRFVLDRDPTPGDVTRVHLPHPELYAATAPGQSLLLDDGKIRLAVEAADPTAIVTLMSGGHMGKLLVAP